MSLFNIRSLFNRCVGLLTIVLLVITANVASFEDGPYAPIADVPQLRILSDRNRLEGMSARLDRRLRLDLSRRVYPDVKTEEVSAERALGGHGQGPRVTAILDRLRKEYERRINSGGTGDILNQRLGDFYLLNNAAELTGPEQGLRMAQLPELNYNVE